MRLWLLERSRDDECFVLGVYSSETLARRAAEKYLRHDEVGQWHATAWGARWDDDTWSSMDVRPIEVDSDAAR